MSMENESPIGSLSIFKFGREKEAVENGHGFFSNLETGMASTDAEFGDKLRFLLGGGTCNRDSVRTGVSGRRRWNRYR
jgi:hypothetical protein